MLLERVEVPVGVQQFVTADDAACGDDCVDGLSNGEPQGSKLAEIPRRFDSNICTFQNDEVERPQGPLDGVEFPVGCAPLQHFGQDEVANGEWRHTSQRIELVGLGVGLPLR